MSSKTFILKTLDESDIEDLYKMNQEIFKEEIVYDKPYLERFCKLKQGFILKNDKSPIGYVIFGMTYCGANRQFTIISIGVSSAFRGKGYGKMLLQAVLDKFPSREISLHVRVQNKIAQKLYKSVGFEIIDIEEGYYHQLNDDAYHMTKPLNHMKSL